MAKRSRSHRSIALPGAVAFCALVSSVSPAAHASAKPPVEPVKRAPGHKVHVSLTREMLARVDAEPNKAGHFQVPLEGGGRAELTLDPRVQRLTDRILKAHKTAYAAAVLVQVDDGRVLALSGRSSVEPSRTAADLCLTPWAPAASIFKLITTGALLASGVKPSTKVCYHDGYHSVEMSNLETHPKLDATCATLSYGLAKSQNAILARLANDHLAPSVLSLMARAFGFGEKLPIDLGYVASHATIPTDALSFARVAAGFWQTSLSPVHGAWVAATIARGGLTPPLHIVSRLIDEVGTSEADVPVSKRILDEDTARTLGKMMVGTTEFGTAQRSFHNQNGVPYLKNIAVAGKTGTLTRHEAGPYLSYSWFVGYAPASHPEVAVSVLVGNGDNAIVKAHLVARELLEGYFHRNAERGLVASR